MGGSCPTPNHARQTIVIYNGRGSWTARKFDAAAAGQLADALAGVDDPARLARVGEWIIECETAADLLAHVLDTEDGTG